jgi:hypothetical protein
MLQSCAVIIAYLSLKDKKERRRSWPDGTCTHSSWFISRFCTACLPRPVFSCIMRQSSGPLGPFQEQCPSPRENLWVMDV